MVLLRKYPTTLLFILYLTNRLKKRSIDNPYITDNLLYGDPILELNPPTSRIIYNNVNGLDLSNNSATLETMFDYMYMHNVDVACMSETNAHWKNQRCKNTMYSVVRQFWKRFHITTSETSTPWPSIYKPGGTATITTTNLSSRITSSGEDPHGLGRWSYITFGSTNKVQLTIVNAYRTCKQTSNTGVSTAHLQQWDILEERNQESENIRYKMLEDLMLFINEIKSITHEVLLLVDANEDFISSECGLSKFTQSTNMTDPIFNKHGNHLEPNTHKNGVSRIDYAFCTPHLEKFIIRCGITPFDLFTSSDHRGLYLDINMFSIFKRFIHFTSYIRV